MNFEHRQPGHSYLFTKKTVYNLQRLRSHMTRGFTELTVWRLELNMYCNVMIALGYVMLENLWEDEHDSVHFWIECQKLDNKLDYCPEYVCLQTTLFASYNRAYRRYQIIPQFISGDLKYHFRLSRDMFEGILVHIGHKLASDHCGRLCWDRTYQTVVNVYVLDG